MSSDITFSTLASELARGALSWRARRAMVRVTGPDARGFLHRMSTQHVEALGPGEARLSALTNKQGRLVELVHHVTVAEDDVLLVGTRAEGAPLVQWLDGFLFVEQVELHDLTGQGALCVVAGARALEAVGAALGAALDLAPWQARLGDDVVLRSFDLLAEGGAAPSLLVWRRGDDGSALDDALASAGVTRASDEALELARVAAGVPGAGEVTDRFNPLELALHDAIHWAKGCYIGQEVIARIDNYGKQARQLVGLSLDDERALASVRPGAEVQAEGRAIGEVTSVSPRFVAGGVSALAVVKLRGDVDGTPLQLAGEGGAVIPATARRRAAEQIPHD